jgi:Trypsin-co-occurring domain 1
MSELVQVHLPDGETMWALVEETGPSDVARRGPIRSVTGLAAAIREVGAGVRGGLAGAAPDQLTVEFGVQLAVADGGLVAALAGVGGNASLRVTMEWTVKTADPES